MSSSALQRTTINTSHLPANDTFTPFPRLPIELRLMIWDIGMPEPRIIEVLSKENNQFYHELGPPAILHACHESCSRALKVFEILELRNSARHLGKLGPEDFKEEKLFYSERQNSRSFVVRPFCSYIDYSRDVLCLSSLNHAGARWSESPVYEFLLQVRTAQNLRLSKVQYLALATTSSDIKNAAHALSQIRSLRKVGLVSGDSDCHPATSARIVGFKELFGLDVQPFPTGLIDQRLSDKQLADKNKFMVLHQKGKDLRGSIERWKP